MAQQQVHPHNPPRAKTTNMPREPGHTRTQAGRLEYEDPTDNTWKPAVRLEILRRRLIQEAPPSLYTHAKEKGYDATDVTTFLAKDQPYGSDRSNRDPLIFQITSTGFRGEKPTGYLKDGGLIVLDAFNHGIRGFPLVLPKCLSTNLGGYDIMNYFRQNQHITLYDLIARMPNGYHEKNALGHVRWHDGPPRYGTVGMRATRFRLHAGLLSWKRRMGSDAKNAKILSLIPANCKDPGVNSTASHRDFNGAEQEEVKKTLVGTAPNRGRYANKDNMRGDEEEDDGYEEESEATIDEFDKTDEDQPRKGDPDLQGQKARSFHDEDTGDHGPLARTVHNTEDTPRLSGDEASNREQSSIPKARHRRSEVTPSISNDTSRPYPFCNHKPSDPPLRVLGSFANPISVNEQSDRRGRDELTKGSNSASDSDEPLAKRQRATLPTQFENPISSHTLDDLDGSTEVDADTELPDYRYVDPRTHRDEKAIQQALELTREDFRQKTRMSVPSLLATKFRDESYISQRLRLQDMFLRVWVGPGSAPQLYCLPAWYGDFTKWKIPDEEGMDLYSSVLE